MTFNGDTLVGTPTLGMVEVCIAEKGFECEPIEAYEYWEKKHWRTNKGKELSSLEFALQVYNGIVINKKMTKVARKMGIRKMTKNNRIKVRKKYKEDKEIKDKHWDNTVKLESLGAKEIIGNTKGKEKWKPYDEQLQDERWYAFRRFIFTVRGKCCECCGSTENLQVHHPKYKHGRLAWEYNCNEVEVLCRDCHSKVHNIDNTLK